MSSTVQERTYLQKLFPIVNNEDLLEFRIPPNVKGNMQLSDVMLRFQITIPQLDGSPVVPENFLGAKQFSSLEVRINGDAISRRSCSNEYFLSAYFQYVTNFSTDYATTSCGTAGIFDDISISTAELSDTSNKLAQAALKVRHGLAEDYVYEILMPIESSIFSCNQSLPTNTPIDLSFERAAMKHSTVLKTDVDSSTL